MRLKSKSHSSAEKKIRYFQLLVPPHYDEKHTMYEKGDIVQDTRDLCAMFANKFKEVFPATNETAKALAEGKQSANPEMEGSASEHGENVTNTFKDNPKKLVVFKKGSTFTVASKSGKVLLTTDKQDRVESKLTKKAKSKSK
jgi:hypothetical protein